MWLMLVTFSAVIFGYLFVTDANRVRDMAEAYLSGLFGGKVAVGKATLTIFEGLRLDDVKVYVDEGNRPDSLVFSAQTFVLSYDPAKIIQGRIEAAQIIAQKPHVHLTQNLDTNEWNFYRLRFGKPPATQPVVPAPPGRSPPLPEVLLRNARVEISEIRGGKFSIVGYQGMDRHITPRLAPGTFAFEIQTQGKEGVGPWATGTASIGGPLDADLHDFNFGRDVKSLLWDEPRQFWERLGMVGSIDVLHVHWQPGNAAQKMKFRVEMVLKDIDLRVPPDDWLSAEEIRRRASMRDGIAAMQSLYRVAGYVAGDRVIVDESTAGRGGLLPTIKDAPRRAVFDRGRSSRHTVAEV